MSTTASAEPRRLKTSDVMRATASELIVMAAGQRDPQAAKYLTELAAELRIRARWIEVARTDEGISKDRRLGIAAIEDVGS